ncbi:uncharacterized protein LOC127277540 isoform X2 [Leptopilina boulardi]|nr:uncharacterized protein LOC127277540 isoform X2 [Leptopilina boulardi]
MIINKLESNFSLEISQTHKIILDEAINLSNTMNEQIFSFNQKIMQEIENGLKDNFLNREMSKCENMSLIYTENAFVTLENYRTCLFDTVYNKKPNLTNINENFKIGEKNLITLIEEAENCVENQNNNQKLTSEKIQCIKELTKKSQHLQIFTIHQKILLKVNNYRRTYKASNFNGQLKNCKNSIEDPEKYFSNFIENIQNCINQKIIKKR